MNKPATSGQDVDTGKFQQLKVNTLFADLRGFTTVSSEHPPKVVIKMLNRYLSAMSEIVVQHDGMVDKFMGDSIMATFGTPKPHANDLQRTLTCAVKMQLAMDDINATNNSLQLPSLYMGIGINTGKAMAGRLGSKLHPEYTVIGDSVNLASRLAHRVLQPARPDPDLAMTHSSRLVASSRPAPRVKSSSRARQNLYRCMRCSPSHRWT